MISAGVNDVGGFYTPLNQTNDQDLIGFRNPNGEDVWLTTTQANDLANNGQVAGMDAAPSAGGSDPKLTMSAAGGIAGVASAAGQIATSISSYCTQSKLLDIQEKMAKRQYDHQDKMAELNRDMQFENLKGQEQKIDIQVQGQKELLAEDLKLRKAQGELAIVEEKVKQKALNEKTAVINKKALGKIFDNYSYGKPVSA